LKRPAVEETPEDWDDDWRVIFGPEEEDGDYVVVFRKDDLDRDSEGPQIIVTGSTLSDVQEAEDEDEEDYESFGNSTDFRYEFRNSAGKVIASVSVEDPDEYHSGWESESLEEASERANSVLSEFADNPGYWTWDGSLDYLDYESGEHTWLDAPEGTALGIRRYFREGAYEQWAVASVDGGVALLMAEAGGWKMTGRTFEDVSAVLARYPGLARLRPGRVTYFDLGAGAGLSASDLVALLDLREEEGSDTPDDWAAKADWGDLPIWGSPIWAGTRDPGLIRRLASIDDLQLSGVDHDGELIPVLADEDGPVSLEKIAATRLDFTGYSMVGWSGGDDLLLIRPGLACNMPTGDALTEGGDDGLFFVDYPDQGTPEERASAIAGWLLYLNFEFYAALHLEPLDPAGTLDEGVRRAWEFSVPTQYESYLRVPDEVTLALRAALKRRSACYRYTAAARANPTGREAQVLHAADPVAVLERDWFKPLEEEPGKRV
jgi:hypothetical protein